jgi:hypothetical protein
MAGAAAGAGVAAGAFADHRRRGAVFAGRGGRRVVGQGRQRRAGEQGRGGETDGVFILHDSELP